jgi:hypothetical protein
MRLLVVFLVHSGFQGVLRESQEDVGVIRERFPKIPGRAQKRNLAR